MNTVAENYTYKSLIHPVSITATTTGTGLNIEDYEDDAMGIIDFGAVGGTTETHDVVFQASLDDSTYVTIGTIDQVTGSNGDNKVAAVRLNLSGYKFLRAVDTMSSTTASLIAAGVILRNKKGGSTVNSATPA